MKTKTFLKVLFYQIFFTLFLLGCVGNTGANDAPDTAPKNDTATADTSTNTPDLIPDGCTDGTACESGICDLESGECLDATCSDEVSNGNETGLDCGGPSCPLCSNSQGCAENSDCESALCVGICISPNCEDDLLDGAETGIDCGGPDCDSCDVGQTCLRDTDCGSDACSSISKKCVLASCQDGVLGEEESDIDCGGNSCVSCDSLMNCKRNRDCRSGICDEETLLCLLGNCLDSFLNVNETDLNCGGPDCLPCPISAACLLNRDCEGGVCESNICQNSVCGDGFVNVGESCDAGGESDLCDIDCTVSECGDGVHNISAGESCDDSGISALCNDDCTFSECGDGLFNPEAGEACDDAGESSNCDVDCTLPECGDGLHNANAEEACDDGSESSNCNSDCTLSICGDGTLNSSAGEDCDDGGESSICNSDCTLSECADGIFNNSTGEACDDGNLTANDGCSAICIIQPGWDCQGSPSFCLPPPNCLAIHNADPSVANGSYFIDPDGSGPRVGYSAYCDMSTDGGGWTLVWKHSYLEVGSHTSEMRFFDGVDTPCSDWSTGWCNTVGKLDIGSIEQMIEARHNDAPVYQYKGDLNGTLETNWTGAILYNASEILDLCQNPGVAPEPSISADAYPGVTFNKADPGNFSSSCDTDRYEGTLTDCRWEDCLLPTSLSLDSVHTQMTLGIYVR